MNTLSHCRASIRSLALLAVLIANRAHCINHLFTDIPAPVLIVELLRASCAPISVRGKRGVDVT